jgi:uncharacterized protein (DUF1800 family)
VLATLEHPAMLQYLDNNQNAAGHINENYARELMELHTLGVDSGYTQQDVQQLARVLTGVGINVGNPPKLKPEWQRLYVRRAPSNSIRRGTISAPRCCSAMPSRASGFGEVEDAVTLIVNQPACARFISRQLASYFVADNPPPQLVERMAQTFMRTDGDIAAVLRTCFWRGNSMPRWARNSRIRCASWSRPCALPTMAGRSAIPGRCSTGSTGLGEAPFGRQTPDGYPLTELNWASSGQMSRRFEIARLIGSGNAGLFDPEDGGAATAAAFRSSRTGCTSRRSSRFWPHAPATRSNRANSQQEWNTFLLSSPDFSYEYESHREHP